MSLRPSDPKRITLGDLMPGDVLLSCGDNALDQLITLVDQGDYSHASLVVDVPANGKPQVVEATTEGIKHHSIDEDMEVQTLVDAYRYVSPGGFHFGNPEWPVAPVTDEAIPYAGGQYAYNELLSAAIVLLAAEESHTNPDVQALLRLGGMLLAQGLDEWAEGTGKGGKQSMTCVQVITQAFWQAQAAPANKYGLEVQMVRPPVSPPKVRASASQVEDWRNIRTRVQAAVRKAMPQQRRTRPAVTTEPAMAGQGGGGLVITAGAPDLPAGMCTPRDMETSPTLTFLGCLKDKDGLPA